MRTILIIDDEESTCKLIAKMLKPTGYRIIQASNGISGIRKALGYHPDLLTVDVMMPHLDGLNMMKILSLIKLQIPSIFVTVKEDMDKYVDLFPSVVNVCTKNLLRDDLLGMVQEVLKSGERSFTDVEYVLNEKEILGLLGKSDRKKILIAADPSTHNLILSMLRDSDLYELYYTSNAQETVFKAVMIQPDLILCDIEMPEIDGIMLARVLYILGHPFPLAFLSEKSDSAIIKKASKLESIQGFLLKNEIMRDATLLQDRIEKILDISEEDKKALKASYQTVDIEKIEDFDMESSVWASLTP
ncbi:MAG: response regulator [Proteobacteria bacterium]|nr:response regulator [Pseudomonadota bacterium]